MSGKTLRAIIGLTAVAIQVVIAIWTLALVVPAVINSGHGVTYVFLLVGSVVVQGIIKAIPAD